MVDSGFRIFGVVAREFPSRPAVIISSERTLVIVSEYRKDDTKIAIAGRDTLWIWFHDGNINQVREAFDVAHEVGTMSEWTE